jgi:hypothetical protein
MVFGWIMSNVGLITEYRFFVGHKRDGGFHGRQTMGEVYLPRLLEVLIAPGDGFPGMKVLFFSFR